MRSGSLPSQRSHSPCCPAISAPSKVRCGNSSSGPGRSSPGKALPNGTTREITNPKGLLIFDADGRYAQVIARDDRPKFKSPSQPTVEELAAATEDFFTANAGTWTVSKGEKLLIQEFDAALGPDNEGTVFRSGISLSGDELRLVSVRPLPTGERTDVAYRRAK